MRKEDAYSYEINGSKKSGYMFILTDGIFRDCNDKPTKTKLECLASLKRLCVKLKLDFTNIKEKEDVNK